MAWGVHPDYDWLKCPTCGAPLEMNVQENTLLSGNVARSWTPRSIQCPQGHKIPTFEQLREEHFGPTEPSAG